jgi:transposase-like protein
MEIHGIQQMRHCPRCDHSVKEMQKIVKDGQKHWLITFCNKCQFNFEIEEFTDKTTSVEEMDKYPFPDFPRYKPWSGF